MTIAAEQLLYYEDLYRYGILAITIFIAFYAVIYKEVFYKSTLFGVLLSVALILWIGYYPWQDLGGDREVYMMEFHQEDQILQSSPHSDPLWKAFTSFAHARFTDAEYLLILATVYVGCHFAFARHFFRGNEGLAMTFFASSMFFSSYGCNAMRQGIAAAIILLAIAAWDRDRIIGLFLMLCATQIHISVALTAGAIVFCTLWRDTRTIFLFWLLSIPVSFVAGSFFQQLFEPYLSDLTHRSAVAGYMLAEDSEAYRSGFRIDFIVYSILPVIMGRYYIFGKGFRDAAYETIFRAYLLANAFWILVIRSNFSDRMAFLSWVLMPMILIYPLFKAKNIEYPTLLFAILLLGQEALNLMK